MPYVLASEPKQIDGAARIILPGVGSFGDAAQTLADRELTGALRTAIEAGTPFLGICLGLQLLFDSSEESPGVEGLAIRAGGNVRFRDAVRVPHIGWNSTTIRRPVPLFDGIPDGTFFYYVHSYRAVPANTDDVCATADYDGAFCAAVSVDNVHAVQFHPEKSQDAGLALLENFVHKC